MFKQSLHKMTIKKSHKCKKVIPIKEELSTLGESWATETAVVKHSNIPAAGKDRRDRTKAPSHNLQSIKREIVLGCRGGVTKFHRSPLKKVLVIPKDICLPQGSFLPLSMCQYKQSTPEVKPQLPRPAVPEALRGRAPG